MKDFKEILEKIAKENGTTPENVLQEMQRAIDEAYDHHDASAQPLWDMMTFKGDGRVKNFSHFSSQTLL